MTDVEIPKRMRKKDARRNQNEARWVADKAYPYPGCCMCGQIIGIHVAHLDHDSSNNGPKNLAKLCGHHHWMFDVGLLSLAALRAQRAHWQRVKGNRTNAYMKDAGKKAAATREKLGIGSEMARKAHATRRARRGASN